MKSWWATAWPVAWGIGVGLLAAGALFLVSSRPRGEAVQLQPPPSPPPLTVHVTGAVAQPGVYALPTGSRVQDAVGAAGGMLAGADDQALNLAALLQDGQKIHIPLNSPPDPASDPAVRTAPLTLPGTSAESSAEAQYPININTASQETLETLPGIGPALARRIIEYRTTVGLFPTPDAIQEVSGIGPQTYDQLKDLITVSDTP